MTPASSPSRPSDPGPCAEPVDAPESDVAPPADDGAGGVDKTVAAVAVVVVVGICSVGAGLLTGPCGAVGVVAGGCLAVANLYLFARVIRGALGEGRWRRMWLLVGVVKVAALFGGVWLLLRANWVPPISLVLGYGVVPLGITLGGVSRRKRPKRPPDAEPPGVAQEELIRAGATGPDDPAE